MKDFLGRKLNEGDEVIYINHYNSSTEIHRGIVVGFTPKKVNIDNYSEDGEKMWRDQKCPHHVVKASWSND